jgi:DnaJ-class molecular chaperone
VVEIMPAIQGDKKSPRDEVRPGTKQAAENTCPKYGGTGRVDEKTGPDCGGSGKVTEIVGDA